MTQAYSIKQTEYTPLIEFDPKQGVLRMAGESYPENAAAFFAPLFERLREPPETPALHVEMAFDYFNSSSSKCLMDLIELLNRRSRAGQRIHLLWLYEPDDEDMREVGEEYAEDAMFAFTVETAKGG